MRKSNNTKNKIISAALVLSLAVSNLNWVYAADNREPKTSTKAEPTSAVMQSKEEKEKLQLEARKKEKSEEFKKKFDEFKEGKDFDDNPYSLFGETYEEYRNKLENCWQVAFDISPEEEKLSEKEKSKKVLLENLFYELGKIEYFSKEWLSMPFVAGFFHNVRRDYHDDFRRGSPRWEDPIYWFDNSFSKYWGTTNPFACRFFNCMRILKADISMEKLDDIDHELEILKEENSTDETAVTLIECLQGLAVESYRLDLQKSSEEDGSKVADKQIPEKNKYSENRYAWAKDIPSSGAYGIVRLYMDTELNKLVAIKMLKSGENFSEKQLAMMQRVNSPYVAKVYGLTSVKNQKCLVMELVQGGSGLISTAEYMHEYSRERILDICIQLAKAFQAFYDGGLVHNDLYCHVRNVLIDEQENVKVIDYDEAEDVLENRDLPTNYCFVKNMQAALTYIASFLREVNEDLYRELREKTPTIKFTTVNWKVGYTPVPTCIKADEESITPDLKFEGLIRILENMKSKE